MIRFSQLSEITGGNILRLSSDSPLTQLLTDSRKASAADGAVFFAIRGEHHDGHQYIPKLIEAGIRQFVVEAPVDFETDQINVIQVKSTIRALQAIAKAHRSALHMPVIGITGSNGKTIIKEWLFQLLSPSYKISKNPGSYNSQIGVPLSVWQLQAHHDLGIFEAGISRPNEMANLESVIQPTIGIFTNLGSAHDEGFSSRQEKLIEKLKLFDRVKVLIYCKDYAAIDEAVQRAKFPALSWGYASTASIQIRRTDHSFAVSFKGTSFSISMPFSDAASIENAFHCLATMLHLGFKGQEIQKQLQLLQAVPMRLELKEGINQSHIIDDTYNNDLAGLQISLDFLSHQHQKQKKRLILSEILESGLDEKDLLKHIESLAEKHQLHAFVGIGDIFVNGQFPAVAPVTQVYRSTEDFLQHFDFDSIQNEIVLVKGARRFAFEKIINRLQRKAHGTVMEIDLGAVIHNLNFFRAKLRPTTKIMAMVKAFAYGSGSAEIANLLQYHKVDYLGVAYADEGIELRKNNVSLPIMVMNPSEDSFGSLIRYGLEPEMYSFRIFHQFIKFLNGREAYIHLKVDTGMHRLGFGLEDFSELVSLLQQNPHVKVATIFSHLAGADDAQHDDFSREQASTFQKIATALSEKLRINPILHLLNSPGILRHPEYQFDMVRLGIGLYGIDPTEERVEGLKPVATLKTFISQLKTVPAGESVGYGRHGRVNKESKIATIAIGYADGFSRAFSKGVGKVWINGRMAPVIGNVCMDMTMVDVTDIEAKEGDEVIIFGPNQPISDVARSINTIPYEILTNTSERVKRVFVAESI